MNLARTRTQTHKQDLAPVFTVRAGVIRDYSAGKNVVDLLEEIVRHPEDTFSVKVSGDSMIDAGIHDGDTLTVDRTLQPNSGTIIIASVDGEALVKRLKLRDGKTLLASENKNYPPIDVTGFISFRILGVVTGLIRKIV